MVWWLVCSTGDRLVGSSDPSGSFPPSFIHQVIIITGLNKLYDYVLTLKMSSDADRA